MCWGTLQIAQGLGSVFMGAAAQNEAADRQNYAYQQNAVNANASASEQYAQNYLRQIQEEQAATQQRMQTQTEMKKAIGTAVASSENSGVSMWNTLHDIERQAAKDANVTDVNLHNTKAEIAANTNDIYNEAQQRINSMPMGSYADPVATALSGLGVVLGAVSDNSGGALSKDTGNPSKTPSLSSDTKMYKGWTKPSGNIYDSTKDVNDYQKWTKTKTV